MSLLPEWAAMENVEITGVHVHLRSQSLDAAALEAYWRGMLCLADSFGRTLGRPLEFVNMGSGMGIPFSGMDVPLDTATLGRKVCDMIAAFRAENPDTRVIIETGRFLTGPAGTYVMKVLDKKVSRGRTFVILCNTMNGFLRPAEAHMISFLAPNAPPAEPLFTAADAFTFTALPGDRKPETVTLAGNLCTAADIIAEDISLPGLERGDAVAVPNAGCYAAALSPMGFSSQTPPAELLLGTDGIVRET